MHSAILKRSWSVSLLLVAIVSHAQAQSISGVALGGVDNPHAAYLNRVLLHGLPPRDAPREVSPVAMTCLATRHDDGTIGMLQQATIDAPLDAVERVLDDIDHFKDLFPDTIDVHVIPGTTMGPRFATAWVQRPVIFFMPDIAYEMDNLVDKSTPGRTIYRYTLRRGDKLIASDGLVVLEAAGRSTTKFTEYDFFKAHWGPIPISLVWRESLRGAFHSVAAIKLKAENPAWGYASVAAEARRLTRAEAQRLARCFVERTTAPEW